MSIHKVLARFEKQIYALLRIVAGFLFIWHGIQKVVAMANGNMPTNDMWMLLAAAIETIGGFLIIIGWLTEWAAFISSGQMAIAYFKAHAPQGLLPINNNGELAVIFAFVFLYIVARGPGIWSIDHALRKKKR